MVGMVEDKFDRVSWVHVYKSLYARLRGMVFL